MLLVGQKGQPTQWTNHKEEMGTEGDSTVGISHLLLRFERVELGFQVHQPDFLQCQKKVTSTPPLTCVYLSPKVGWSIKIHSSLVSRILTNLCYITSYETILSPEV